MPDAHPRFIPFVETSDNVVHINPGQVAFVRSLIVRDLSGPIGEWAEIATTAGTVTVNETAASVVAKLQ